MSLNMLQSIVAGVDLHESGVSGADFVNICDPFVLLGSIETSELASDLGFTTATGVRFEMVFPSCSIDSSFRFCSFGWVALHIEERRVFQSENGQRIKQTVKT